MRFAFAWAKVMQTQKANLKGGGFGLRSRQRNPELCSDYETRA